MDYYWSYLRILLHFLFFLLEKMETFTIRTYIVRFIKLKNIVFPRIN